MSAVKKVATIGGATQDIFIHYRHPEMMRFEMETEKRSYLLLEEGKKIDVSDLVYQTGGGATNSAVSFKRLGCDVVTISKIGFDQAAEFILQDLELEGIETRFLIRDKEKRTGTSYIIPFPSGDRVVLVYRGVNARLQEGEIHFAELASCNQFYITPLSGASSKVLLPLVRYARERSIPVAINPGHDQLTYNNPILLKSLSYIDVLILNFQEACALMSMLAQSVDYLKHYFYQEAASQVKKLDFPRLLQGALSYRGIHFLLQDFFKEILGFGPRIVAVTNGAEGVYIATQEQILFHPSLSTKIMCTLGAGDAFGSTFVASLLHDYSIQESLVRGIINSTCVIAHIGAKTGLLARKELDTQFKNMLTHRVMTF